MYPKYFAMRQSSQLLNVVNKSVLFLSFTVVAARPVGQSSRNNTYNTQSVSRVPLNSEAKAYIAGYIRENREDLHQAKCRSKSTFRMIDRVFTQYGLPAQMKYLAVIESQLKSTATSAVGARGLWQLMPQTAQLLGLKVEEGNDERVMNYKSTIAAAKYLKDLYSEFGDWLLVLAAYNGGPGPVYRAIKKSHSRDFWALQYFLPAESRLHVKRFIASHYYFEGKGSITTLTRAEWVAYANNKSLPLASSNLSQDQPSIAAVVANATRQKSFIAAPGSNISQQVAMNMPQPSKAPLPSSSHPVIYACLTRRPQYGTVISARKREDEINIQLSRVL
jgi:membrane-bound lytic murein transglycosylase D